MWGIDRLSGGRHSFVRKRLRNGTTAVLTHAAALDRRGRGTLEVLDELGVVPTVLFTPEHGFDGWAQAEESVPSAPARDDLAVQSDRGAPHRVSLYGSDRDSLTPSDEQLNGISALVIDLVDIGSRYYTYVWSALLAARKAASLGVHTVILDRPNPLGSNPEQLEGKPQADGFLSFVGLEPIAIRHGLTIAELLTAFLSRDGLQPGPDGAFTVVGCKGWERWRTQEAWGRPFIPPSPNMPSLETALMYPGGCLVEGTNLSEGRGTSFPFRVVGAPFIDGKRLAKELGALQLPGVVVRPTAFKPTFEKHAGTLCHGVMLHVTNAASFRPVATYLSLLTLARAQAPSDFTFRREAYEFEAERLAFDLLTGSSLAREAMEAGASATEVADLISPVGPEVKELWASLEPQLSKATAQPATAHGGHSLSPQHSSQNDGSDMDDGQEPREDTAQTEADTLGPSESSMAIDAQAGDVSGASSSEINAVINSQGEVGVGCAAREATSAATSFTTENSNTSDSTDTLSAVEDDSPFES
ncbi:MAG TPA: DUF1343 domain-containing protein [Polyangiaceae bacterium]|jgi:uncharacterized protein YbbC (DUF1343 family)|nr:DUF1343 domain-containing protein [Polyangiaceae bacterium]